MKVEEKELEAVCKSLAGKTQRLLDKRAKQEELEQSATTLEYKALLFT